MVLTNMKLYSPTRCVGAAHRRFRTAPAALLVYFKKATGLPNGTGFQNGHTADAGALYAFTFCSCKITYKWLFCAMIAKKQPLAKKMLSWAQTVGKQNGKDPL